MPDWIRTKETMEKETAAVDRGNQINVAQWLKVRVVDLLELNSSSHTNLGKIPKLSKPSCFIYISQGCCEDSGMYWI